jgi:hypothetical protein
VDCRGYPARSEARVVSRPITKHSLSTSRPGGV